MVAGKEEKIREEEEKARGKEQREGEKELNCGGHQPKRSTTKSSSPSQQPTTPQQKKPQQPKKQTDGPLSGNTKPPMDFIAETAPIKVHGAVVASTGGEDPALGCPVEFIDLRGTSRENPAVCKYTGNRYYSDDWAHAH